MRETIEILINLSSYNATIEAISDDCFMIMKQKDIKIDLFYIALFQEFDI